MDAIVYDIFYSFHEADLHEVEVFERILKQNYKYTTFFDDIHANEPKYRLFLCFISQSYSKSNECVQRCKQGLSQNAHKLFVFLEKRTINELDNNLGSIIAPYLHINLFKDRRLFDPSGQQFNLLMLQIKNFLEPSIGNVNFKTKDNVHVRTIVYNQGTFKGQVNKRDIPNGKGTIHWNNGDLSTGKFLNGKLNGHGKYTWKSGSVYEGEFKDNEINGLGKYFNGDLYVGHFKNGKKEGRGKYYWHVDENLKGDWYEGEYKADKKDGHGKYYWADGRSYQGTWKNDFKHGHGVYHEASGKARKQFYSYDKLMDDDLW